MKEWVKTEILTLVPGASVNSSDSFLESSGTSKGNRNFKSLCLALEGFGLSVIIGCFCAYCLGRKTEKMKPSDILRQ